MVRSALIGLINNKLLYQKSGGYDDGIAVTLMSSDSKNAGEALLMFHEIWAQMLEVLLGMIMLARKVGWVSPVPLIIIFCRLILARSYTKSLTISIEVCSRVSRYLAKNLQGKQRAWNLATQERIAITTSMLASMKNLKMLGVTPYTECLVQKLRLQELAMAQKVRWMRVAHNASGMLVLCAPRLLIRPLTNDNSKCSRNILSYHNIYALCPYGKLQRRSTRH